MIAAAPANVATNAAGRPERERAGPGAGAPRHGGIAIRAAPAPTNAPAMNQKIAMKAPLRMVKPRAQTARADVTIHTICTRVTMSQAADILSPTTDKNAGENRQLQAFRMTARVRSRAL